MGALELALRQLREKLAREGLFDPARKRPLPAFVRRVAVVTSPTGAAIRDFLQVLGRRWRGTDVLIVPVRVQGDGAAAEIAAAIETVNQFTSPVDCLVVTRGGGSMEDLWAFNEEPVVRAIAASQIPVISAVGSRNRRDAFGLGGRRARIDAQRGSRVDRTGGRRIGRPTAAGRAAHGVGFAMARHFGPIETRYGYPPCDFPASPINEFLNCLAAWTSWMPGCCGPFADWSSRPVKKPQPRPGSWSR